MKSSTYLTAFIFTSICLIFFLIYKTHRISQDFQVQQNISLRNYKTLQESIGQTISFVTLADIKPLSLNDSIQYYDNSNKTIYSWTHFCNNILLIIPEHSCNVCYDDVFEALNFARDSLNIGIKALTTIHTYKEVKNTFYDFQISNELYFSNNSMLFHDIALNSTPYFLYVDETLVYKHLFIPLKNQSFLTKNYLSAIKKRYFSSI